MVGKLEIKPILPFEELLKTTLATILLSLDKKTIILVPFDSFTAMYTVPAGENKVSIECIVEIDNNDIGPSDRIQENFKITSIATSACELHPKTNHYQSKIKLNLYGGYIDIIVDFGRQSKKPDLFFPLVKIEPKG